MLIVDGYNWLFSVDTDPGLGRRTLERQRNQAIRLLTGWAEWHTEAVVIVFDGAAARSRQQVGGVEVWFTPKSRTADDEIVARVRAAERPREVRVVTADRLLGQRVRAEGGVIWSPRDFSGRLKELQSGQTMRLKREDLDGGDKPDAEPDVDGMVRAFEDGPPPRDR